MRTITTPQKLAYWAAVLTFGIVAIVMVYAADDNGLIPGPIAPAHSTLSDKCSGCHTNIEDGRLGWLHGLVRYADPANDAKACLACHTMGDHATRAHTLSVEALEAVSERQDPEANDGGGAAVARLQKFLFPVGEPSNTQVFCATCHKEHRPEDGPLSAVPDERCHSCHKVQFEHFAKDHPGFGDYPFRRRARIVFDHADHFAKRFPEMREKKPDLKIPKRCADCHTSTADKGHADRRHMGVKPFAETCSGCHLPQIVGEERATGPKGVALLALPEIDLETLKEKTVNIGSWPEDTEAELTPLMKLLLGRDKESRALLQAIDRLDLVDLSEASDNDIAAVAAFVWEVKALLHALATSKPSEAISLGPTPDGVDNALLTRLLAAMPQDVVLGAQREWLPKLDEEMATRPEVTWEPNVVSNAPDQGNNKKEAVPDTAPSAADEPQDRLATDPTFGIWGVDPFGELVQAGDKSKELERAAEAAEAADDGEEGGAADGPTAVGPEEWAELGGWYRGDYAIHYKPTGHSDTFLRAWLDFTGRLYGSGDVASSVFDLLTSEDAQGSCTQCHSVDAGPKGSRIVQWHPSSFADKSRVFTKFVHEPHFPLLDKRGCLTCHKIGNAKDFEEAYLEPDPAKAIFNFKPVAKKVCANCHKQGAARQNCSLCHNYHVTPVVTPITRTKLPKK